MMSIRRTSVLLRLAKPALVLVLLIVPAVMAYI